MNLDTVSENGLDSVFDFYESVLSTGDLSESNVEKTSWLRFDRLRGQAKIKDLFTLIF